MKKIAAVTMVRNDYFFLQKWVEYYTGEFGKENLFIFFDGADQVIPEFCEGINCKIVEKIGDSVLSSDKGRIKFISSQARELFAKGYQIVVGGDADEYLVVDPLVSSSLAQFLSDLDNKNTASGLGLDFGQLDGEPDLSLSSPFLSQRHYAQIGTRYTKASVLFRPLEWGAGFHRVKGKNFNIVKDLYLMHFGYSDHKTIESRFSDSDRLMQGWERHMKKRKRVIRFVNKYHARKFDSVVSLARILESFARPPYAWNKPALLGLRIIVKIPARFDNAL